MVVDYKCRMQNREKGIVPIMGNFYGHHCVLMILTRGVHLSLAVQFSDEHRLFYDLSIDWRVPGTRARILRHWYLAHISGNWRRFVTRQGY